MKAKQPSELPKKQGDMSTYSIYIHLPFCLARCPYCDFYSTVSDSIHFREYRNAIAREWRVREPLITDRTLGSLYIGGGTPSLWPAEELQSLLGLFPISSAAEVSVEVNPGDAALDWFAALADCGVNRFSIGAQAFDDKRLELLGRRHDSRCIADAVLGAREPTARSIGVDIIYGTPGQRAADLQRELQSLVSLGVDHVSAYELTVVRDTPWKRLVEEGHVQMPDEDEMADLWQTVGDTLEEFGFERYEVSNFARPGHRCRHNEQYWRGGVYLGLGAGAHGFIVDKNDTMTRYMNARSVERYLETSTNLSVDTRASGMGDGAENEKIAPAVHARELVMLGLRTSDGVNLSRLLPALESTERERWLAEAKLLEKSGLARVIGAKLVPTSKGMLQADALAQRFF